MSETHATARAAGQAQASRLVRLRLSSLGAVIMLIGASLGMSLAFAVALACYVVLVFALPSSASLPSPAPPAGSTT